MTVNQFNQIADRFVPPVGGIDLEQSLNFVDSKGIDPRWFYTSFTYPRVFYKRGARPGLEAFIARHTRPGAAPLELIQQLLDALSRVMPHYCQLGYRGQPDRGAREEALIASGRGWCNEQARAFVALTQVAGFPSRLVFADTGRGQGHVVAEVLVDGRWILVDQTEAMIFTRKDGSPVNVADFRCDETTWREIDARYKTALLRDREKAPDKKFWDEIVPYGTFEHPLELFTNVGYCNYFIHE